MSPTQGLTRILPAVVILTIAGIVPGGRASSVHAQGLLPVVAESHVRGGTMTDMVIEGRYLYALTADRLTVFDVEAPNGVEQVGSIVPSGAFGSWLGSMALEGSQLLVSDTGSLWRFDLTQPDRPREIDRFSAVGSIVDVEDGLAYLELRGQLNVVDVEPTRPMQLLASAELGDTRGNLAISAGRLLTIEGFSRNSVLRVIDLRTPNEVAELGRLELPQASHLRVRGDHVYLSTSSGGCGARSCLAIVDISDPANPRLSSHTPSSLSSFGNLVDGLWDRDLIAFQHIGSSTQVEWIDVSDPGQPSTVGVLDMPGVFGLQGMLGLPDGALFSSTVGLHQVDLNDPAAAAVTALRPRLAWTSGACAFDDRWLVFGEQGGAWLLDATGSPPLNDTARVGLDSRLVAWGHSAPVACGPDQAFATSRVDQADTSSSLGSQIHMLDLTDPGRPMATTFPLPESRSVTALTHASSGLVTIEDFNNTNIPPLLRTWDSSSPEAFAERGRLEIPVPEHPAFSSVAADGSTIVLVLDRVIYLIDVSDPDQPRMLANLQHEHYMFGIDIEGDLAVAVDANASYVVVDLPGQQILGVHAIEEAGDGYVNLLSVVLDGSRAYLSGAHNQPVLQDSFYRSEARLWSVDLQVPERPVHRSSPAPSQGFLAVDDSGERLGVSGSAGFAQLRLGEEVLAPTPTPTREPTRGPTQEIARRVWLPVVWR